jgi:hypothetical protein
MKYHRWIALLITLAVGAVAGFVCLYALVQLGAYTGVIAMCGSAAPPWWVWTFVIITPVAILAGAIAAAFASARWYRARCGQTEI